MAGVAVVAVAYDALSAERPYEAVAAEIASRLPGDAWTVVAHSGAGGLVPSILAALDRPAGAVFVDAILPHPGRSWLDTAPPALAAALPGMATGGRLPPWNMWFPADPLERMIVNGSLRAVVTEALPMVPASWIEARAPATPGLDPATSAYLQLSAAYAAEALQAQALGWRVTNLALHHLAMITNPGKVADALCRLTES